MSGLLAIGSSAVRAYSTALATIGENVSNASTPGYTRRTVSFEQAPASSNALYASEGQFNGVTIASVQRAWNDYQAAAVRDANAGAAAASAKLRWLDAAETALGDDATGVGKSATAFFNAGDALAADPGGTGGRRAFLATLDQTATAFRTTAAALKTVSDGTEGAAQTAVTALNASLDALDKINAALRAAVPGTAAQANLMDQRDRTIDAVAGQAKIDVTLATDGTATVRLAGGGLTVASGTNGGGASARLVVRSATDGRLAVDAIVGGKTSAVGDVGGALGGLVEAASQVADRRNELDRMATDFATTLNGWSANGRDADGAAGAALLAGTGAADLKVATADPKAVPAASATTANGNLLALTDLRGKAGVEAGWAAMTTVQGQVVASAKALDGVESSRAEQATSAFAAATGVDLDTEAAELIRFQQAYSAAAKIIQAARETMQTILDVI